MNRRNFLQLAGATAGASVINSSTALPQGSNGGTSRKGLMKVGTQHGSSDEILEVLCSLGVNNICSSLPSAKMDANWTVEGLTKLRERVESYGIHLDMVPLPLSSAYITRAELPSIMMAKSPERDRDIDSICQMIRNVAKRGHSGTQVQHEHPGRRAHGVHAGPRPFPLQHICLRQSEAGTASHRSRTRERRRLLGADHLFPRTRRSRGRGIQNPHRLPSARSRACRHDKGYRGVQTVLGSVDGLKRFLSIKENPYHGLNFCQGTVSEMLQDPGKEILDVIRHFGSRKKIFNVHFRNIKASF